MIQIKFYRELKMFFCKLFQDAMMDNMMAQCKKDGFDKFFDLYISKQHTH